MFSERISGKTGLSENKNNSTFFQPKLTVNQPNDLYEQEADRVAESVVNQPNSFFASVPKINHSISPVINRCACNEEKEIQRKENTSARDESETHLEKYTAAINSSGNCLPKNTANFFNQKMGYDFSNVKIHTDSIAAKSADSINAHAYTTGNHIVFNQNQYQPETTDGKKLLAHELTHVVQQQATQQSIQRKEDDKCRKDIPDLENPELLGPAFIKKDADLTATDKTSPRIIKNLIKGTNYFLYSPLNNAGCDSLRPLITDSTAYIIKSGLFYDLVWAKQPDTKADLIFTGWVDKKYLQAVPVKKVTTPETKDPVPPVKQPTPEEINKPPARKGFYECDDPDFCKPYTDPVESEMALKNSRSDYNTFVKPLISSDADSLWQQYLSGAATSSPFVFKSDSTIAENYADCYINDDMIDDLMTNIKELGQKQCIKVFPNKPIAFRVDLLTDLQHRNPILEYNSLLRCADASLTAGGMGGTDGRYIAGTIWIEPYVSNDASGEMNYNVWANLEVHVTDAVDFCPGQCGAAIEQSITIPMSRNEARGIISSVPFEVYYKLEHHEVLLGSELGICEDFLTED